MTHDYVVACLQAGHGKEAINIDKLAELAEEVKSKGRRADKEREEHERIDRRNGHY